MTHPAPSALPLLTVEELAALPPAPDAGLGCLRTSAGNLPLRSLTVAADVVGLTSRVLLTQRFVNPHAEPLEATYVFPLPDRGAVTRLRMTAADRTVEAALRERAQARAEYDAAIATGHRAAIAEEDRPEVLTLRVGNILPGEEVTVELTVVGVLPVEDGEATFRFPLVVAPRYVPGAPLPGDAVGSGYLPDTDAVPDASRISPPVLLPGFPHPVELEVSVSIDPAGLPLGTPRSSLHAVEVTPGRVRVLPGARADRDVVLRLPLGRADRPAAALTLVPDAGAPPETAAEQGARPVPAEDGDGTFELVVLPPNLVATPRPRDVVLLLDRSGSMAGWKMVAARRSAARIVDTLTSQDRFTVLAFDSVVESPGGPSGDEPGGREPGAGASLLPGTDRHRFRAVEFLAAVTARGGTELSEPLGTGLRLLAGSRESGRDAVLVLVTDGQVGNEDQLLRQHAAALDAVRVHVVGIDQAVNAGFLGRLAGWGGGRCELVESEDRLDDAMARIHERIGSPLITGLTVAAAGFEVVAGSIASGHRSDLFPGVPWVLRGRYRALAVDGSAAAGSPQATVQATVQGTTSAGEPWSETAEGRVGADGGLEAVWAREQVRRLEDRVVVAAEGSADRVEALEQRIVRTSLRHGVLCRYTVFVAVDDRVVTDGAAPRAVIQPVEQPAGWASPQAPRLLAASALAWDAAGSPAPMSAAPASAAGAAEGARARGGAGSAALSRRVGRQGSPVRGFAGPAVLRRLVEPVDDRLTWELLRRERDRLQALAAAPTRQRRSALSDLASILRVTPPPADAAEAAWRRLLDALDAVDARDESEAPAGRAPFERTWQEVVEALVSLVEGHAGPAFWRHRPET